MVTAILEPLAFQLTLARDLGMKRTLVLFPRTMDIINQVVSTTLWSQSINLLWVELDPFEKFASTSGCCTLVMLRLHLYQGSKSPHRPAHHREQLIKDVTFIQSCITFAHTYLVIQSPSCFISWYRSESLVRFFSSCRFSSIILNHLEHVSGCASANVHCVFKPYAMYNLPDNVLAAHSTFCSFEGPQEGC